jgi:hypothetical protein
MMHETQGGDGLLAACDESSIDDNLTPSFANRIHTRPEVH